MRELPDFEDSLAFLKLNFGIVCTLSIDVCNTEPCPIHFNAAGGTTDLIRLIQQKAFFSSIKVQNYLLMSLTYIRMRTKVSLNFESLLLPQ